MLARSLATPTAVVREGEPNDDAAHALVVALGDSANGTIGRPGDKDFYALDLTAGTRIDVKTHDGTPANGGDPWQSTLTLIDRDGSTVITNSVYDYIDHDYRNARLRWTIQTTGRYYVVVANYQPSYGDDSYTYGMTLREFTPVTPGPGDPTTQFASVPGYVYGLVAGPRGDLYTTGGDRVYHVSASGAVTTFVTGVAASTLGIDQHANVYVGGCQYPNGLIWRVTPSGEKTLFYSSNVFTPTSIAVGPDGDIWVADAGNTPGIVRFSPAGERKDEIHMTYVDDFAFSPSGDLHFLSGDGLYRLVGRIPQKVSSNLVQHGVFDRDGYMYGMRLYDPNSGAITRVVLLDPQFNVVKDSFAVVNDNFEISELYRLAFLRDANGHMTKRLVIGQSLLASQLNHPPIHSIRELNPAAIRASGFGFDFASPDQPAALAVVAESLSIGSVGSTYAETLHVKNASGSVTWAVSSGAVPPGITLTTGTGVLSGTPSGAGSFAFTVRATDGKGSATGNFGIAISAVSVSVTDVTNALLGAGTLDAAATAYLDSLGNKNGKLDIGDLRAFLKAHGQLP